MTTTLPTASERPFLTTLTPALPLPPVVGGLLIALFIMLPTLLPGRAMAQATPPSAGQFGLIWDYPGGVDAYKDAPFVPGELLVGVHEAAVGAAGMQMQAGMEVLATIEMAGLDGAQGNAGVAAYRVRVPVGSEWTTIAELTARPGIAFATPNWLVTAAGDAVTIAEFGADSEVDTQGAIEPRFAVDDPLYAGDQWYLQRVNASRAWALLESVDMVTPIRVAIVDSGVDATHPELFPHLLPGKNYVSADPTAAPVDDYGHGTHVAGVVAATLNNGLGMAGLAPNVQIDPRKVLNSSGSGSLSDVADAIRDATLDGAQIINMSLEASVTSPVLDAAVEYAAFNNVLLVGAAGNCTSFSACPPPIRWPAAYPEVIAVGSTDYWDRRASYSAVGPELEIMAPGGVQQNGAPELQIYSAWAIEAVTRCAATGGNYQFIDGGSYCNSIGTSMSAAVFSGVAALVWSAEPTMTADELRLLLNETAVPLPLDATQVGNGRVDAQNAMLTLQPSDVQLFPPAVQQSVPISTTPFSLAVTLMNPSLEPLSFVAAFTSPTSWVHLTDTANYPSSGTVSHGDPSYLVLRIDPSGLVTDTYSSTLSVIARYDDGTFALTQNLPVTLLVGRPIYKRFLPFVGNTSSNGEPILSRSFRWEVPNEDGRVVRTLTDGSNVGVALPFSFTMGSETYTDMRLYSDGFISFPGDASVTAPDDNHCMPLVGNPPAAIYGWWADLDPSLGDGQVSYFRTKSGDFVVEFLDVESAADVEPGYTASFQIVLQAEGDIWLNYMDVPEFLGAPGRATLGASHSDGRFHNRIFCATGDVTYGLLPAPRESFELKEEDLY
jgi:hypothetical protein